MSKVKIKAGKTGYHDRYQDKRLVLLKEGQPLEVVRREGDYYICKVPDSKWTYSKVNVHVEDVEVEDA